MRGSAVPPSCIVCTLPVHGSNLTWVPDSFGGYKPIHECCKQVYMENMNLQSIPKSLAAPLMNPDDRWELVEYHGPDGDVYKTVPILSVKDNCWTLQDEDVKLYVEVTGPASCKFRIVYVKEDGAEQWVLSPGEMQSWVDRHPDADFNAPEAPTCMPYVYTKGEALKDVWRIIIMSKIFIPETLSCPTSNPSTTE